jgi:alpha-glucosidase
MDGFHWWQRGIIYQIYPRSFLDSDGDGVGDLPGILERLDYLDWLGVDAVWVSPFYPSPMKDFGYDVSDYTAVHPLFGTMEDFDRLVEEAHRRGLRIIVDLVPNHTSDQHPWFLESRSSRDNPKRDWYLWVDPAENGGPPNNWRSVFGGSGWEWDEATGQYYFHAFLREQPDLNWRNREVQKAMLEVMRFWLDRGVDGFRIDVLWHLVQDERLRDNPPNPDYRPGQNYYDELLPVFSTDQPEVHDIVAEMRLLMDDYGEGSRVMIGELYLPIGKLVAYYGHDNRGAHLPFNFQLLQLPWDARQIEAAIDEYEGSLPEGGWPNWVLGNHDKSRIASRVGAEQARVAAMLLLTLRGTPTLYYGDELGMSDGLIPPEKVQDPQQKNMPDLDLGRDPARTPMHWDDSEKAGFTTGDPWLPVGPDHTEVNVARQREDPDSMLSLHRRLIDLRHAEPALQVGCYDPVRAEGDLVAFIREHEASRLMVVLNLGHSPAVLEPQRVRARGEVVVATHRSREGDRVEGRVELAADEGVVIRLDPATPPAGS